jgi:hypothetical protein
MSQQPDQIRADIERTRADLAGNIDALENKVSPSAVAHRTMDSAKGAVLGAKDRIIGTSHDTANSALDGTAQVTDKVKQRASGSPLVAGGVAFGIGFLLSGLFPATRKEAELGATVKDKAADLKEPVQEHLADMAHEVKENVSPQVSDALNSIKGTATEATATVKESAGDAAGSVKESVASPAPMR